jgi:hypothetical protein
MSILQSDKNILSSLNSFMSREPGEPDLAATTTNALQADAVLIRAALLWIYRHPELSPLFYTISKYAANHTMTSCFSEGLCKNCNRTLHFLGMDVDHVGTMDLCESAFMSVYAELIHHPLYSMELATKGLEIIREAISDLAAMPAAADAYHTELAKYIMTINGTTTAQTVQKILKEGQHIYNKNTAWLYVGLPEVLAKIGVNKDTRYISNVINQVYDKWRHWGIYHNNNIPKPILNIPKVASSALGT